MSIEEKNIKAFFEIAMPEMEKLLISKNAQYGDATSKVEKIIAILFPNGIEPDRIQSMLLLVRVLDKICRIAENNPDSVEDAWSDIIGYAILAKIKEGLTVDLKALARRYGRFAKEKESILPIHLRPEVNASECKKEFGDLNPECANSDFEAECLGLEKADLPTEQGTK